MSDEELAKDLGLVSAMTIGIGTMIGAGIFVLPGVAANAAGPIVVVSFLVGGLIAMVNALSVAELGTAMPKAGGYRSAISAPVRCEKKRVKHVSRYHSE